MSSHLVELLNESTGQAASFTPIKCTAAGSGSQAFTGGQPAILHIDRAGVTNTLAVWGADAGDPNAETASCRFQGDGATTTFDAPALMTYAAFANYNWIVEKDGVVLTETTDYTISNPASTTARVTFAAAPANKAQIILHKVTPVAIHAAATTRAKKRQVRSYDFAWPAMAAASSASSVYLIPTASH